MNPKKKKKKKGKEEEKEIFSRKCMLFQILNAIPKCRFIERVGRRINWWEQLRS
jgi:hypothetical protein